MIYLDNAATSFPKPKDMTLAMEECITKYCGNPGRSGHYMSLKTGEGVYRSRLKLAKFFGVDEPERVVFTKNTTEALNMGIKGLLKPGDHVITTSMEHNSVLRPLKELEMHTYYGWNAAEKRSAAKNISVTIVGAEKDGSINPKKIEEAVCPKTRLIIVTAASNITGTVMPLAQIGAMARRKGILFMVDGAQGAGTMEIDVKKQCIDILCVPGHKGLLGPLGTGALYAAPHIEIEPICAGGTGTESKNIRQPREFPEGYEAGTVNAPAIIGLGKSLEFIEKVGRPVIDDYERDLISWLDGELLNMEFIELYGPREQRTRDIEEFPQKHYGIETADKLSKACSLPKKVGISLINVKDKDPESVTRILSEEYGIAVRGGFHCAGLAHKTIGTWDTGAVRISVGPFNTKKDMKCLVDALWKIGKI